MKKIFTIFSVLVFPFFQIFGATFVVSSSADSGPGTLRQAVLDANALAGEDTVTFDASTNGIPLLITVGGDLIVEENLVLFGNGTDQTTIQDDLSAGGATLRINTGNLELQDIRITQFYNGIVSNAPGSQITTTRCLFEGSVGSNTGISAFYSRLTINECYFESIDNWGVAGEMHIECNISNTTFSNCTAGAFGLSSHSANNELEIFNCTFVDNGQAISIALSNDLQVGNIYNNTIYNNNIAVNIIEDLNGTSLGFANSIQLVNNIISSNSKSLYIFNDNFLGAFGGNPITSFNICDGGIQTSPYGAVSWSISSNPLLDPSGLIDNGGPTPTVAILVGSPAIDGADPLVAPIQDQRLYGRSGTADIGAFEYDGVSCVAASTPSLVSSDASVCPGETATLTITGSLNDDLYWAIYTGSCGGILVGTTAGTTFDVTPGSPSTTYYIRGEGGCEGMCADITINVTPLDDASFTYSAASYCMNAADPTPIIMGLTGGTFTFDPVGLDIDGVTGEIDLSNSIGQIDYTVTYTTNGACPNSEEFDVYVNPCVPNAYLRWKDRGKTMSSFGKNFYTTAVSGATQYEWRFTPQGGGASITQIMPDRRMTFAEAGITSIGVTYDVQVRAYRGVYYGDFAFAYQLTTPNSVPNAKLRPQDCGITVSTFNQVVYSNYIAGASQFEFQFSPSGGGASTSIVRTGRDVSLLDVGLTTPGVTYDVVVRATVGGVQGSYGAVCQITAPAGVQSVGLRAQDCGVTMTTFDQTFYSGYVAGATGYEFEFTPQGGGAPVEVMSTNRAMTLDDAGLTAAATTYDVRVRAYIGANIGTYAGVCTLSSPGSAIIINTGGNGSTSVEKTTVGALANGIDEDVFAETNVYPNPFKKSVNIDFESNVHEKEINIYNSVGQLLKTVITTDNSTILDLSDLKYGVYMMQIRSGDKVKTTRLVKN